MPVDSSKEALRFMSPVTGGVTGGGVTGGGVTGGGVTGGTHVRPSEWQSAQTTPGSVGLAAYMGNARATAVENKKNREKNARIFFILFT